jgi:hypothetical protein
MEVRSIYPPASRVDIGDRKDNDPPVFEEVKIFKVSNAIITSFGYVIDNFSVLEESISYRHRNTLTFKNKFSFSFFKKKIKVKGPALSIAHGWYNGYYHFTLECLPKLFMLREYLPDSTLVFPKKIQKFHSGWFELLGIKNILFLDEDEVAKTPLVITTSFPARDLNHHDLIMPEFSNWVLSHLKDPLSLNFKKIFIGRKDPLHRKLINVQEVKDVLTQAGFTYVVMEDHSVADQLRIFSNAEQMVSVHGASLSNLCFSKAGTKVLDLMHEDFKQWCFLKLSIIKKLDYSILPCKGEGDHPLPGYKDIKVDITALRKKLGEWI